MKLRAGWVLYSLGTVCLCAAGRCHGGSPGQLDLSFRPGRGINGAVHAIAAELEGRVVIGGDFTLVRGAFRSRIARLNADGSADLSFNPGTGPDQGVRLVALQADHKAIIAGLFTSVNGVGCLGLARLNPDGSVDHSFGPGAADSTNLSCLVLQPDGKVLVAGGTGPAGYFVRRLNGNGSLDATFDAGSGPNAAVACLALQPDGQVLVGGSFTTLNGMARGHLARLHVDGSLDTAFDPGAHFALQTVCTLALQPDGKVVAGTYVAPGSDPRIPRFYPDGTLDSSFTASGYGCCVISLLAMQADASLLVAGSFSKLDGTPWQSLAHLDSLGNLDASFAPGLSGVATLLPLPNGKALIAGTFSALGGVSRAYLARINPDGTVDQGFDPGTESGLGNVYAVAAHTDGRIILGGDFTWLDGVRAGYIARLNHDGSLDTSFRSGTGADGSVRSALALPAGQTVIGGEFTSFDGVPCNRLARLKADGSLDTSFNASAPGWANTFALTPDGKVVVAGMASVAPGTQACFLCRLNPDGSTDAAFNPPVYILGQAALAIAVQPDGKVLAGSASTWPVRFNLDGSQDYTFSREYDCYGKVSSIALQGDGKIVLAGWFNWSGTAAQQPFIRLMPNGSLDSSFPNYGSPYTMGTCVQVLPDGALLMAGGSAQGLLKLLANGSLDATFAPPAGLDLINLMVVAPEGNLLLTGEFNLSSGPPVLPVVRLFGTVTPPNFHFGPASPLPGLGLCLSVVADSPASCQLEATTNLGGASVWSPLARLTNTLGELFYTDYAITNSAKRFYRLRNSDSGQ